MATGMTKTIKPTTPDTVTMMTIMTPTVGRGEAVAVPETETAVVTAAATAAVSAPTKKHQKAAKTVVVAAAEAEAAVVVAGDGG